MEKRIKHTIWSNSIEQIDSIVNDCSFKEWCEEYEIDDDEYVRWNEAAKMNNEYLDDERMNLNIDVHSPIIAIADLGLWDGRKTGYKMIRSTNIKDCLYTDCDYSEWYCDAWDFRATMTHHDGTNYVLYRARKADVTDYKWDNFLYKLYTGKATRADITRNTFSLQPYIAKVYGWKYRTYPKTNYWDKKKFTGVGETKRKVA